MRHKADTVDINNLAGEQPKRNYKDPKNRKQIVRKSLLRSGAFFQLGNLLLRYIPLQKALLG